MCVPSMMLSRALLGGNVKCAYGTFFIVKAVGIYAFFRPAAGRQKGDLVANSGYSWSVLCWSSVGVAVY